MYRRIKNRINRKAIFVWFILISVVFNSLGIRASADANDRITAFINMAAGKQTTDLNTNSLNLSEKDLQFLGVYISNFFVPFGTELGTDNDVTSMNKTDIKSALQTNLSFSDAMASSLTDTLLNISRSSIKELVLCVSEGYQSNIVPVPNMPLNYYTALSSMLGGLGKIADKYKDNSVAKGIVEGRYEYGYFAYLEGGKYIPVFDFDIDMSSITPSTAAFIKALESNDIESGFGFNFFDFTKDEMGTTEGDYKDKIDSLTDEQISKMSIYGTTLKVDCFGNIILMGGNHQFVAVPGAMNPYTWVAVDENGKDKGLGLGGTAYNVANFPSMALQDNKSTGSTSNSLFSDVTKSSGVKKGTLNTSILVNKLKKVASSTKKGEYSLRKVRGDKNSSLDSGVLDWIGVGSDFRELAKKAEQGYVAYNPLAKNYFGIKDGLFSIDTKYIDVYGVPVEGEQLISNRSVNIIDSFVYTDNLGAAHFDDSGRSVAFKTFNTSEYISNSESLKSLKESMASWGSSSDNGFTNTYKDVKNGKIVIPTVSKEATVGLYITYAWASLYNENSLEAKKETIGKLGYRLNSSNLPSIADKILSLSSDAKADIMLTSIRDWTYYLLHPTEGASYFITWCKTKLNSLFVSWHDDMVGTNGTGSINGTTKYRGFTGYVTTPELSDIPFTNSLLEFYNNAIPFILIFMILMMLGSYVVGVLTLQKAIIGFLIFAFCAFLPSPLINMAVGTSNRFSSSLYGEKFTYWALVQHESYADAIDEAADSGSYSNYLKTLYETNAQATGNQGSESIMVKWQAPKKMSSLMLTEGDKSSLNGFGASSLLSGLFNKTYSGENYLDDAESVYLYRSYIDIANASRYIHRGLAGSNPKQPVNLNLTNDIKSTWNEGLKGSILNYDRVYEADRAMGYANKNGDGSSSGSSNKILRVKLPLSSYIVTEAYGKLNSVKNLGLDDYVGINQDAFNFAIPMFNVGSDGMEFREQLNTDNFNAKRYTNEDFSGLAAYGLMSENPFYYFSWYLYESGLTTDSNTNIGYKNLLLGEDKAGFFYNSDGNGELKDFMDMRSLFTYIIPYLKQGNDLVKEWDKVYGVFTYNGIPTEEGHQNDPEIKSNPEMQQKYWHNLNVARLYNVYTPWVDVMYDSSYSKSEKINYLGESYVVQDPINPSSYPSDRPMIFSKSEMVDYGLSEKDLTTVERKILKVQEGMQKRMFKLLNYYNFSDVVLNTAAAMNCAFEFNTVFSENGIFGYNKNIYPQSFELSDFSYDAFLRFILSNTTGESMLVEGNNNFYKNIVNNSSITTIIVMLALDVLAMYVVPGLKLFFIIGVFIMFILNVLIYAFKVDTESKFINKMIGSFIRPLGKFLMVTCGMALVVSWFMGEGNTAVTGSVETSISLGDPVMVLLVMVILNGVVVFSYFKILWAMWKDIKSASKLVGNFITGVVGSVGGMALASALGGADKALNGVGKFTSGASDYRRDREIREIIRMGKGKDRFGDTYDRGRARRSGLRNKYKIDGNTSSKKKRIFKSSSNIEKKTNSGLNKLKKNKTKGSNK